MSKSDKETWDFLKTRHVGADCVIKARVQALRHELIMGEEESMPDFARELSSVTSQQNHPTLL